MRRSPLVYGFCLIVLFLYVIDNFKGNKMFSQLENRNLASRPEFSFNGFISGNFSKKYEDYVDDQFVFRDKWINVKSIMEEMLGKIENNNIIIGKDGFLFDKVIKVDKERINTNIIAVNNFIEKANLDVTTMIVPNSYEIYKEKLYYGLNLTNQREALDGIYRNLKGNTINLIDIFDKEKEKYIYYKTDHHWTTYGAYLAYKEFINMLKGEVVNLEGFEKKDVEEFYGTYFSRAKPYNTKGDVLTYYEISNIEMQIDNKTFNSLYDYSKLQGRDKYEIFINGNNPLTIIRNKALNNKKKLLIFKDSYGNSLTPFLSQNYEEIHVVDLRSFGVKVSEYIKGNTFDNILIIYNFANFISDMNFVKIKY